MVEKFSMSKGQFKDLEESEIQEGIFEYLNTPKRERMKRDYGKSIEELELEVRFESEIAEKPLRRKDIEKEAENFIDQNF